MDIKEAAPPFSKPTHFNGVYLFTKVIDQLKSSGWEYHRIDTLRHVTANPADRAAITIRHRYDHGVWWLFVEPDRYWDPKAQPLRVAKIDLSVERLPTADEVIAQLFGEPAEQKRAKKLRKTKA